MRKKHALIMTAVFFSSVFANTLHHNMVWIPGGSYDMGGDNHLAKRDEFPKHTVKLTGFWMDKTEVTNAQFARFVKATGYVTTAEKKLSWDQLKKQLPRGTARVPESQLEPGSLVFIQPSHQPERHHVSRWWKWVKGASWKHPLGPSSSIKGKENEPVVQVSWYDAMAYCHWAGKTLPTEAQWEWASRGGYKNKPYGWGDEPVDHGAVKANTWQGEFPHSNTKRDGYLGLAPVKSFPPNRYGLYDMAGNVWEWVGDYYSLHYYLQSMKQGEVVNPQGPLQTRDLNNPRAEKRVLRGGSFLCNVKYCSGYRVSARMRNTPDSSTNHIGFRCVLNTKK